MSDREDIRDEFSPLLDDELSPDARDAIETALAQDAELLRELERMRKLDELYKGLPRESAPPDMAERVRDELHPRATRPSPVAARSRRNWYTGLAAAAMFGVVIGGLVLREEFVVSTPAHELAAVESEATMKSAAEAKDEAAVEETAPSGRPEQQGLADAMPAPADASAEAPQAASEPVLRQMAEPDAASPQPEVTPSATAQAPPPPPQPMAESEVAGSGGGRGASPGGRAGAMADADDGSTVGEAREMGRRAAQQEIRRVASRSFVKHALGWCEQGYDNQRTTLLPRDEAPDTEMPIADWERLLEIEEAVIFKHDDVWYQIPPEPNE